jgi:hypothetical protein
VKKIFFNFTYAKEESSFIRTLLESCMSYLCKSGTLKDTVKDTKLKCTKAAEQSVSHRKKERKREILTGQQACDHIPY